MSEQGERPAEPEPAPPPEPQTSVGEQELPPEPAPDAGGERANREGQRAGEGHGSGTRA